MENIFNRFQIRPLEDKVDFRTLENLYKIQIPPIFQLFVETFKMETFKRVGVIHVNEEVGFHDFELDLRQNLEVYREQGEYYQERGMLPIATSANHSGGICVGTRTEERDSIFIDNEMYEGRFEKIADNIFEFIRGLKIED